MLDFSRTRVKPFDIQRSGIEALVKWDDPSAGRIFGGCFALFDEMGVGKTKQTIDAAQFLYDVGDIDRVVIVAPSGVRSVWFDEELGELTKHGWLDIPHRIAEFHGKFRSWDLGPERKPYRLGWIITNYEFIRRKERLNELKTFLTKKTLLVLDESSAVKTYSADQTKACIELRKYCRRVTLLNGTPIANHPGDMFAQGWLMDPRILDCKNKFHFEARYAVKGGYQNKVIVGWRLLDDLQRRFAPYVLRRLTEDSIELPKKNPPIQIPVPLTETTWTAYRQMRSDMVAWLNSNTMATASQAGVKAMRLAQLTSGFVGGVEDLPESLCIDSEEDELATLPTGTADRVIAVGTEKLDATVGWIVDRMERYDWDHKILVWSRFRPEVFRLFHTLAQQYPEIQLGLIIGSQKRDERRHALRLLDPRTAPKGPVVVIGTPASGSMGLNCTAAFTQFWMSVDFNLKVRLQGMARTHRAGQTHDCDYFDLVAVGPNGQKTINHHTLAKLGSKENLAIWTTGAWRQFIRELAEE